MQMMTAVEDQQQAGLAAAAPPRGERAGGRTAQQALEQWGFPANDVRLFLGAVSGSDILRRMGELEQEPEFVEIRSGDPLNRQHFKKRVHRNTRLYWWIMRQMGPIQASKIVEGLPPGAERAWLEILKVKEHTGPDQVPTFSNPAIGDAVTFMGGWPTLREQTDNYRVRNQFVKAYQGIISG